MPSQPPISLRVRPQPMQNPVSGSTTHILTQGVSIGVWFIAFMEGSIAIRCTPPRREAPLNCRKTSSVH
jgi:hypothetical protein